MNTRFTACLLLLGCVLLAVPAGAQNGDFPSVRSKIIALEHAWNQAQTLKDLNGLDALFDKNFVYVDFDGRIMTKSEFLLHVRAERPQLVTTESLTVQLFENTAIVLGNYRAREDSAGRLRIQFGRFIDTWVYRESQWVCVSAQSTPILR